MRLGILMTAVLAGLCSLPQSAAALSAGDRALGNYQGAGYWFPAVVSKTSGDQLVLRYDDGDVETLPASAVKPYTWQKGYVVECNFQGNGTWYQGRITDLDGSRLTIAYDDGDREETSTGRCRSR